MFPSGSSTRRGGLLPTAPTSPLRSPSLKRRRSGVGAEEQQSPPEAQLPDEASFAIKKPRREQQQHTFQLSFLTPPTVQDSFASYKTYQPTPPLDSDSDSSSDRFAALFASVPVLGDDDDDDDEMMDVSEQRVPRVVIGPPTPVTEVMGRLDVSGDVDVDMGRPEEEEGVGMEVGGVVRKKSGVFRMGFRGDCEKCRLRVPGHYSHY